MPPALETWEFHKHKRRSSKRKLRYFKDENNVANMNGVEPLVSSSTTTEESWQLAPPSDCFADHHESPKDRPLPLTEQSTRLSRLSLIDPWSTRNDQFSGAFGLNTQQKKSGCGGEKRDVDRTVKRSAPGGFHRRQGSGDLYVKLRPFDNREFNPRKEQVNTRAPSSRYVVTGHGSWGDFGDSLDSIDLDSIETTSHTKTPVGKLTISASDQESFPSGSKEGITLAPGNGGVGGVSGLKEWYKNRALVLKATSKQEVPPKSKYLRKLVLSSWKHNGAGAAAIFNILGKRPLQSSPVIALKGLNTIHKLLQQGSAECRAACYNRLQILTDTVNTFNHSGGNAADSLSYGPLVCAYASMLIEKATFHHRFQAYENNYSVDIGSIKDQPSQRSGESVGDPLRPEALLNLQRIQGLILVTLKEGFSLFRKKIAALGAKGPGAKCGTSSGALVSGLSTTCGESDPTELVVSVLIPILREADLVYDICWFLLSTQISIWRGGKYGVESMSSVNEMTPTFASQHKALRKFFEQAKTVDAITCNVTPPNLPVRPPCLAADASDQYSRLPTEELDLQEHASTLHHSETPADPCSPTQLEVARPRSVPTEGTTSLQIDEDIDGREVDHSWLTVPVQPPAAGRNLSRQEISVPVLGGVGAAAAAAMQRFVAGQIEAKRVAAAAVAAPTGLRNVRLEPPPGNVGTSFHLELGTIARPGRPQHTRGTGRTWSSFDDEAFLHQHQLENLWSPVPRLVSPKFYSPRAPGQCKHGLLSPVHIDSTNPLLFGFVSSPPMNETIDPFIGSPPAANLAMEVRPSPRLAIGLARDMQQSRSPPQSPEHQAQSRYPVLAARTSQNSFDKPRGDPPPLIELETVVEEISEISADQPPLIELGIVVEEQSTGTEMQVTDPDRAKSPLRQEFLNYTVQCPASWQLVPSMTDAAHWGPLVVEDTGKHSRKPSLSDIPLAADWEIPVCELKLGPKIGQGAFGDVLRGSWQGTDVAVKRLQNNASYSQAIVDIRHEVAVIMRLRHPNIILFMGACTLPPEICIVMEFAANGSLYGVLHNPNVTIDMATVVRWASEAARGMNYLHTRNPPVVHRDLKSVNLLVDGDWHIKVSDFGLAMTKQSSYAYTQVGTWGWMAPEVLESAPYNEKADVYSFGVVLWELITREEPFRGYHPMQIMRAIDRGERPVIPEGCPHPYKQLVHDCWQKDPKGRPTFEEILSRLGAMSNNLSRIRDDTKEL